MTFDAEPWTFICSEAATRVPSPPLLATGQDNHGGNHLGAYGVWSWAWEPQDSATIWRKTILIDGRFQGQDHAPAQGHTLQNNIFLMKDIILL